MCRSTASAYLQYVNSAASHSVVLVKLLCSKTATLRSVMECFRRLKYFANTLVFVLNPDTKFVSVNYFVQKCQGL